MTLRSALLATLFALPACGQAAAPPQAGPAPEAAAPLPAGTGAVVIADILGANGSQIGTAEFREGPHGLLLRVMLAGGSLAPGWHGLHLHQTGDCSDTGTFTLSGGHVGKVDGGHGLLNPDGPEGGDTPNIFAHADGSAAMETAISRLTLADLEDEDGSALIIHAGEDDHVTQPIGGAGARVACAAIR